MERGGRAVYFELRTIARSQDGSFLVRACEEGPMGEPKSKNEIAELDDVELIRLLTREAGEQSAEVIALATAEAGRRGLPIDEAFIPSGDAGEATAPETDPEARPFLAGGNSVTCPHCGGDRFEAREILLNTRGLTFFKLDWMNRSATALVCGRCGLVQMFAVEPTEVVEQG
jgi:hypothetical protein